MSTTPASPRDATEQSAPFAEGPSGPFSERHHNTSTAFSSGVLNPRSNDLLLPDDTKRASLFEERQVSFLKANENHAPSPQSDEPAPFMASPYTRREYTYAICVGILLSFNSGYVNGSCLSGLVAPSGIERAVTSHTGTATKSALALSGGDTTEFGFLASMLLCFALGSFIAGSLTPNPKKAFRVEPTYGPTFLLGASLLAISSYLAAVEIEQEQFIFYLASAANGIQNGISTIYSANLIRSTGVTGTSTDIGIFLGQHLRGNRKNTWKLIVLLCLWISFWMGGLVSLYATSAFTHLSLLFNGALYLLIGGSLVLFLHMQLHVSVTQAIFGIPCSCVEEQATDQKPGKMKTVSGREGPTSTAPKSEVKPFQSSAPQNVPTEYDC